MTVTGMFIGAALAHNLGLAASATALNARLRKSQREAYRRMEKWRSSSALQYAL